MFEGLWWVFVGFKSEADDAVSMSYFVLGGGGGAWLEQGSAPRPTEQRQDAALAAPNQITYVML